MRVGIIGPMMSGKTSTANFLTQYGAFEKVALADELKMDVIDMLNYIVHKVSDRFPQDTFFRGIDWHTIEDNKTIFRPLLQFYGTDFWRDFMIMPEVWLERLSFYLTLPQNENVNFVTDDVRFPNEGKYLKNKLGYTIVKLIRPPEIRMALLRDRYPDPKVLESVMSHPSETQVDNIPFDYEFHNDRPTLKDLAEQVQTELIPYLEGVVI